jgi:uncharacterized protein with HEPN domain
MLDAARRSLAKAQATNRSEYDRDENLQLALTHLIQIVGEAARRVSPSFQQAHPEILWSDIIGMRHVVVHHYFRVDEEIVWQVASTDLKELIRSLESIIDVDS